MSNFEQSDKSIRAKINYKEYGEPYEQFIESAKIAREDGRPDFLNDTLKLLSLLKIDDGYTLDSFKYSPYYYRKDDRSWAPYDNKIYVRRINATGTYDEPNLTFRSKLKLFFSNNVPDGLAFTNKTYNVNQRIIGPLHTEECIKNIPSTLNYITVQFSQEGLWQYFMYLRFINGWFDRVVFSQEDIKEFAPLGDLRDIRHHFEKNDYERIKQMNLEPELIINGSTAKLKVAFQNKHDFLLLENEIEYNSGRLTVHGKVRKIGFLNQLRICLGH